VLSLRAPALVVVLVGLPGAGKSTLTAALARDLPTAVGCRVVTVCVDEVQEEVAREGGDAAGHAAAADDGSAPWVDAPAWHAARGAALRSVACALDEVVAEAPPLAIIVDDNAYYHSMRKPYASLARGGGYAYAEVELVVPPETAAERNDARPPPARVPPDVISRMARRLEHVVVADVGDDGAHGGRLGIAVDATLPPEEVARRVVDELSAPRAWLPLPPLPPDDAAAVAAARAATRDSVLHHADLTLRACVGAAVAAGAWVIHGEGAHTSITTH